jgi:hypothetical protein
MSEIEVLRMVFGRERKCTEDENKCVTRVSTIRTLRQHREGEEEGVESTDFLSETWK